MKKKVVALKEGKIFRTLAAFEDEDQKKLLLVQDGKIEALSKE
jgi:hypothetical protein